MRDFTENFERLEDIQGKFPASTLVLRAQFVYMLQDQFRDLERDYGKISEMYVAEMEKAAKLEQQVRHEKSESDKLISEKNTKIIQLRVCIENYNRIFKEIITDANHQKHKRCLAKAENTLNKARDFESMEALAVRHNGRVTELYMKKKVRKFRHWRKWLELAEKFKVAK